MCFLNILNFLKKFRPLYNSDLFIQYMTFTTFKKKLSAIILKCTEQILDVC